ncbi:MAG: hypothetical protein JJ992_23690, partial [Planctomycetes bacterium]|nr:hypothetical protein [Planctomycetota bacterium]
MKKIILTAFLLLPLAACETSDGGSSAGRPSVGNEYDLSSFEGARAGQAEMGLQNLGYQAVRTQ